MVTDAEPRAFANPATRIIAQCGAKRLASWTGRHHSRVHAWSWPVSKGGTGGVVPHKVRAKIIAGAKADLGLELTLADFEPLGGEAYDFADAA